MGKPVLSMPINDPFRIPIKQAEGTHWCRVRERNRFLFCAWKSFFNTFLEKRSRGRGVWIQSEAAQMEQGIMNLAVYIPLFIYCYSKESLRSLK